MKRQIILIVAATIIGVAPGQARDAYMSPMDFSAQTQALTSNAIDNITVGDVARRQAGRSARNEARPSAGGRLAPSGRGSDARLPFASTAASRRQALDAYLARAQRQNPKAAAHVGAELRRRNLTAEMTPVFVRYGLRIDDAADVVTVLLVGGYDIIVGRESTVPQVRAVRRQIAGRLLVDPAMRNPATRTKFAEELKITTYIVGASESSAKRDGQLATYRRGLVPLYRQIAGENIATWRMTPAGFQR